MQLFIEQYLKIGRSYINGNVFFGFLQIGYGSFQVQLGQCVLIGNLQSGENRDTGTEAHIGSIAGSIDIYCRIVTGVLILDGGLRTPPVPVLTGTSVQVRQACPFGRIDLYRTLFGIISCPPDVDVVLNGIINALAERPPFLRLQRRTTTYQYDED